MSQAGWDAYDMEWKSHNQTLKERDKAEQKLEEALLEIQRLEAIITKHGGWGFTPYSVRKKNG